MAVPPRKTKVSLVALALRIGWGTALLAAPGVVIRVLGGPEEANATAGGHGVTPRRIAQVLGVRHLIEGFFEAVGGRAAGDIGIGVDLIHWASDVGFAGLDPRWRRAALTDAVITGGFAVLGFVDR